MLWIAILPALLSNDGTPDAATLKEMMEASVKEPRSAHHAPPSPMWPEGLPNPVLLQPGDVLETERPATCYPDPTDFVLDYHLLHWEAYPGKCQRKLNTCWAAYEEIVESAQKAVTNLAGILMTVSPPEDKLPWVWIIVSGVVFVVGIGTGYLFGRYL